MKQVFGLLRAVRNARTGSAKSSPDQQKHQESSVSSGASVSSKPSTDSEPSAASKPSEEKTSAEKKPAPPKQEPVLSLIHI